MFGPTGFDRAPVSKFYLLLVFTFSIIVQSIKKQDLFTLSANTVFNGASSSSAALRILCSPFVFTQPTEMVLGLITIYKWRIFERLFGPRKFAGALLLFSLFSMLLNTSGLALLRAIGRSSMQISSGPFCAIFAFTLLFFTDIPPITPFSLFFIPLSDKSFVYILIMQLLFATTPSSCFAALLGLFAGALYKLLAPLQNIRAPVFLANFCQRIADLFSSNASGQSSNSYPGRFTGGGAVGRRGPRGYAPVGMDDNQDAAPIDHQPPPQDFNPTPQHNHDNSSVPLVELPVDESAINELMAMGFDRERATQALRQTQNNVQAAINRLIDS